MEPSRSFENRTSERSTSCQHSQHGEDASKSNAPPQELSSPFQHTMSDAMSPGSRLTQLLGGKGKEWTAVAMKDGPLRLLDLPLDLLRDILKEVTHTNDLTSLALTNSAMHSVVTPLIYSRFDIVWPDALNPTEPRTGVDALTYGLATLVMREDLFENAILPRDDPNHGICHTFSCRECGTTNYVRKTFGQTGQARRLRRGNYFSQFTRKFSLGNGPADWVQEYLVTKESGKMLGTLVALSIARMPNLESFVWDMPTGVLRDIWISLSSLGDYEVSKLKKVWIRFHDNKAALQEAGLVQPDTSSDASEAHPAPNQDLDNPPAHPSVEIADVVGRVEGLVLSNHHIERPNFSILPSLQSLTVLAIDELAYLDEMSVLIERSRDKLREVRIGLATKMNASGFEGGDPRLKCYCKGGELALLMSKIYVLPDTRKVTDVTVLSDGPDVGSNPLGSIDVHLEPSVAATDNTAFSAQPTSPTTEPSDTASYDSSGETQSSQQSFPTADPDLASIDPALTQSSILSRETEAPERGSAANQPNATTQHQSTSAEESAKETDSRLTAEGLQNATKDQKILGRRTVESEDNIKKLRLETLEFEKVLLNVPVLKKVIDFQILTSLTLLHCQGTENLWKDLKRSYAPMGHRPKSLVVSLPTQSAGINPSQPRLRPVPSLDTFPKNPEYQVNLKRIHTNTVSPALISFLSSTLAPNSLEWLFLQDSSDFLSPVTIDAIHKGPLRRHRSSLTKILINSAMLFPGSRPSSVYSRKWMLNREVLTFITSGKIAKLRELAVVVEYKDWHYLLQSIPRIPHLRSLHIPYINDHVYGPGLNVKEMAMGVVDVVSLRPEIELCYLGISTKCFEITEVKDKARRKGAPHAPGAAAAENTDDDDDDDDSEIHDDNNEDEDNDGHNAQPSLPAATASPAAVQTTDSDDGDVLGTDIAFSPSSSSDDDEEAKTKKVKLKLREILFYDDKISVFKARHARL